jgi:hypothetical protein
MPTLAAFPKKDQLTERTIDGRPPENGRMDCVFTSSADAVEYLTGRFTSGDELKDEIKGEAYRGGASAAWLPAVLRRRGVLLTHREGATGARLLEMLDEELAQGHPSLATIPSHWATAPRNPQKPGASHCIVFFSSQLKRRKDGAVDLADSRLVAMNPWHGVYQSATGAWWAARLCYGQIWPLARLSGGAEAPAGQPAQPDWMPAGWSDDGSVLKTPSGYTFVRGFREAVLRLLKAGQWRAEDVPLEEERYVPLLSYSRPELGGGSLQRCRYTVLTYTAATDVQLLDVGAELGTLRGKLESAEADAHKLLTVYEAAGAFVQAYNGAA